MLKGKKKGLSHMYLQAKRFFPFLDCHIADAPTVSGQESPLN
ncbi:hypothetical protein [Legionella fallonii]|nr:hypothetical protein [Legionella fallonii]